jgi:hypothetical protein
MNIYKSTTSAIPKKFSQIDWNMAYEAWNRAVDSQDKTEFIEAVFPVVAHLAERKSYKYRGRSGGKQIDQDSCESVAMDALLEIAAKRRDGDGTDGDWMKRQTITVISRRFIDLKRKVIGRRKVPNLTVELNAEQYESDTGRIGSLADKLTAAPSMHSTKQSWMRQEST